MILNATYSPSKSTNSDIISIFSTFIRQTVSQPNLVKKQRHTPETKRIHHLTYSVHSFFVKSSHFYHMIE